MPRLPLLLLAGLLIAVLASRPAWFGPIQPGAVCACTRSSVLGVHSSKFVQSRVVAALGARARTKPTGQTAHRRPTTTGGPPRPTRMPAPRKPAYLRLPSVLPEGTLTVPILMYHHLSSLPPATELNRGLTVTGPDFAAQLAYLRGHGYHIVLLRDVFNAFYAHRPLPARPIVLTFDDGYTDNATEALPILRRYHAHAEFNIISAYVGQTLGVNSYMNWRQLRALVTAGMEIGSHTVDHQDLGTLSEDKIRFELRDSRNILQRTLGLPVQFLAYPAGEPFVHGSDQAQQLVLSLMPQYGYVGALLDGPLTTAQQHTETPFQLQRIRVSGGEDLGTFAASLP